MKDLIAAVINNIEIYGVNELDAELEVGKYLNAMLDFDLIDESKKETWKVDFENISESDIELVQNEINRVLAKK